jgi:hypothetical protein
MLAKSWMPELDKIVFELQEKAMKKDGRIVLLTKIAVNLV